MANHKNTIYYLQTTKATVPASSTQSGTIQTVGKAIEGAGTSFMTEMPVGSWLVDLTQNEIRKVIGVDSDILAYVSNAFTIDIPALTPPDVIQAKDAKCVSIAGQVPSGAAAGLLDGETFPAGTSFSFSKDSRDHSSARDLVDPIIVDAAGTQFQILIQK